MKKMFSSASALILLSIFIFAPALESRAAWVTASDYPTWIMAPSINLFSPIQGVGVNDKGDMDVPSGETNNVGWYEYGALPGEKGVAVLDAHVFAAFRNLSEIQTGEYIYIFMASGKILSFKVKEFNYYALNTLSPYTLFTPTSPRQINLITCAGNYIYSAATYDHRLIVSAELV